MWLCQDVLALRQKWDFYKIVYAPDNLPMLSDLGVASFKIIEETLRDSMVMVISRLSDPPQTGPRREPQDNLTIRTLIQFCGGIPNLIEQERDFLAACAPVRQIRNKLTGHNDLNTRLQPEANPLPGVGRDQVDTIITLAEMILNTVLRHYVNSGLYFQLEPFGGGKDLIFWLKYTHEHMHDA